MVVIQKTKHGPSHLLPQFPGNHLNRQQEWSLPSQWNGSWEDSTRKDAYPQGRGDRSVLVIEDDHNSPHHTIGFIAFHMVSQDMGFLVFLFFSVEWT